MASTATSAVGGGTFSDREKPKEVRKSNISACKAILDLCRTSLGPKGMDKMIITSNGQAIMTNDGATLLEHISALHPAARMLVDLSKAQDVAAGDGTTSVVVIAGSLLSECEKLLNVGIHPTQISDSFLMASSKCINYLENMAKPIDLMDRSTLIKIASTSLNSKIVSQHLSIIAPIAVDAVLSVTDLNGSNADLRDIRLVAKVGGTIEDTELMNGVLLNQNVIKSAGGPTRIEKAKIGLIQFQLSPPKPDMDNQIVVNDYRQMDKILKEERQYLLNMCKKIKKSGCNVLLIQKSILRDAVNEISLHFMSKLKIMVIKDIERDEIDFICKSTGCKPIADIDSFSDDKLGTADLVEEIDSNGARIVQISGVKDAGRTVSVLVRSANDEILEETERSLHDALCVVRCLVKKRAYIAGGGAPETEIAVRLSEYARTLGGTASHCIRAFAEALEIIPMTLAENAGLDPISIVTELRARHAQGEANAGINIRKGTITNILEENVLQPLLVSTSAIELATETVRMLLKIDDIVQTR
ncbi:T-complex protein 1 [Ramicandelaber brevisporus]|nr:T-complex protein 1 [Ramicandelaber brevisporus]